MRTPETSLLTVARSGPPKYAPEQLRTRVQHGMQHGVQPGAIGVASDVAGVASEVSASHRDDRPFGVKGSKCGCGCNDGRGRGGGFNGVAR